MYWKHFIVSLVTLTFAFLTNSPTVFAQIQTQNQTAGVPFGNDSWTVSGVPSVNGPTPDDLNTPRTEMERARRQAEADVQPSYVPQTTETAAAGTSGQNTVSVTQLRHPLSRKGMRLIKKVESYLKIGQRAKAKEQLAEAMKEPSAAPYAHAILGTEYLRDGKPAAAIPELEDAARVLPIAGVHSNLGYALCLTGHGKRGQQELEEALRLDGDSPQTRFLIGIILLNQKSQAQEAQYNLKMAQDRVRSAHLGLAVCDILKGEMDAAQKQVRQYLGPERENEFFVAWQWVSAAAADPHPAAAFGFRYQDAD